MQTLLSSARWALLLCGLTAAGALRAQLLWTLQPPGGGPTSYLFGTMHLVPGKYTLNDEVTTALRQSDHFVMEVLPDMPLSEQIEVARLAMTDPPLPARLDSATFARVRSEALALGVKPRTFDRLCAFQPVLMVPGVLAMALDDATQVDQELWKLAKKRKKNRVGLESAQFQIQLLTSIPIASQLELFAEPDPWGLQELETMAQLYRHERLDSLHLMVEEGLREDYPALAKALLADRNRAWVPQLEALSQTGTMFVAVGAGHLSGPEGLIALLRERGWICSRFMQLESAPDRGR